MRKDKSHYLIRYCKETKMYEVIDLTMVGFPTVFTHETLLECEECKSILDDIDVMRGELNGI